MTPKACLDSDGCHVFLGQEIWTGILFLLAAVEVLAEVAVVCVENDDGAVVVMMAARWWWLEKFLRYGPPPRLVFVPADVHDIFFVKRWWYVEYFELDDDNTEFAGMYILKSSF